MKRRELDGALLFAHMIVADSDANIAMTQGRNYFIRKRSPESLSRHEIDLILC